jgi:hypothetical protein
MRIPGNRLSQRVATQSGAAPDVPQGVVATFTLRVSHRMHAIGTAFRSLTEARSVLRVETAIIKPSPTGRVGNWRADVRVRWNLQRFRAGLSPAEPRHVKPGVPFSGTGLSCRLHTRDYETSCAGRAVGIRGATRYSLQSPNAAYSHCRVHRFQPKP